MTASKNPKDKKEGRAQHRAAFFKERFLDKYRRYGLVVKSARATGIDASTFYKWQEKDPDFALKFEQARKEFVEVLEAEAIRRASKGILKPVFYKGGIVGKIREYSDTLLIVLLKANEPKKYRELHELTGPDGGPVMIKEVEIRLSGNDSGKTLP